MRPKPNNDRQPDGITPSDSKVAFRTAARFAGQSNAEDVAQEALLAALNNAPLEQPARAYWIASVARRIAANFWRRESSLKAREQEYAKDREHASEEQDSQSEVEYMRNLIERLDFTSRTLLIQRYFEGQSLAEISEQTSTPIETVRTRHYRAILRLRTAATKDKQPNRDWGAGWILSLLSYFRPNRPALAACVAAVAISIVGHDLPAAHAPVATFPIAAVAQAPTLEASDRRLSRASLSKELTLEKEEPGFAQAERHIRIVAQDFAGSPIAGAEVHALLDERKDAARLVGTTDDRGFLFVPARTQWLYAQHPSHGVSMVREVTERTEDEIRLRTDLRDRSVRGRVVDPAGQPLAGAQVQFFGLAHIQFVVTGNGELRRRRPMPADVSGPDGTFELPYSRLTPRKTLQCELPGYDTALAPFTPGANIDFVLQPSGVDRVRKVTVLDEKGGKLQNWSIYGTVLEKTKADPRVVQRGYDGPRLLATTDAQGIAVLPHLVQEYPGYVAVEDNQLGPPLIAQSILGSLPTTWVIDTESSATAYHSVSGSAPPGSALFLRSPQLLQPIPILVDPVTGQFEVQQVPAISLELMGMDADQLPLESQHFELQCEADGDRPPMGSPRVLYRDFLLQPPPRSEFTLSVIEPDGSTKRLRSDRDSPSRLFSHTVDSAGHCRVVLQQAGEYIVGIRTDNGWVGHARLLCDDEAEESGQREMTMRPQPLRYIRFPPDFPSGTYLLCAWNSSNERINCRRAYIEPRGTMARIGLPEGTLRLVLESKTGPQLELTVTILAGEDQVQATWL